MRLLTYSLAAAGLALIAAPASAQTWTSPTWSGSAGYANVGDDSSDANLDAVTLRATARFTPYFGAEGELSTGLGDEDIGGGVDAHLSYDAALYGVGYVPVNQQLELFGRVGYGTTEIDLSSGALSANGDNDSWNYGVGANYFIDGVNGVRADYTRREFQNDGGDADVWSVSYVRRF